MTTVPPPIVDEIGGINHEEIDCNIDREFWLSYLRDLYDFDPDVLGDKPDPWIYARAKECMDNSA